MSTVIHILAVIVLACITQGVFGGSYCQKSSGFYYTREYCIYGCCNSFTSFPCCSGTSGWYGWYGLYWGIGVGLSVLAIIIVIIVVCCCRRRRTTMATVVNGPPATVVYSQNTTYPQQGGYPQQGMTYPVQPHGAPGYYPPPQQPLSPPPQPYAAGPPAYSDVTSGGTDNKGYDNANM